MYPDKVMALRHILYTLKHNQCHFFICLINLCCTACSSKRLQTFERKRTKKRLLNNEKQIHPTHRPTNTITFSPKWENVTRGTAYSGSSHITLPHYCTRMTFGDASVLATPKSKVAMEHTMTIKLRWQNRHTQSPVLIKYICRIDQRFSKHTSN